MSGSGAGPGKGIWDALLQTLVDFGLMDDWQHMIDSDALMDLPVAKPKALLADKGYDGDTVRSSLLIRGILPIIPPKSNRREPVTCDFRRYRDRNHIERMFGHLKHQRRIATRYDKSALSFASFLNLAAIRRWLPNFVNRS